MLRVISRPMTVPADAELLNAGLLIIFSNIPGSAASGVFTRPRRWPPDVTGSGRRQIGRARPAVAAQLGAESLVGRLAVDGLAVLGLQR